MSAIQSVLCFIINEQGQCLMLKRKREPHGNQWNAPGGKIMAGEDPEQACRREVMEETGLVLRDLQDMGSLDCVDAINGTVTWRLHIFIGRHPRTPVLPSDEGEFSWLGLEKLCVGGEDIVHNIPLVLPLLLRGIPIQGYFVYRDDFLERYNITLSNRGKGLPS